MGDKGFDWDELIHNITVQSFTKSYKYLDDKEQLASIRKATTETLVKYLDNSSQQEDNNALLLIIFLPIVILLFLIYVKYYIWPSNGFTHTVVILTQENIQSTNLPSPEGDPPSQTDPDQMEPPPQYDPPPSYDEVTISVPDDIQLVQKQ